MTVGQTLVKASKLCFFSLFLYNTAVFALKSGSIGNCPISSTNFSAAFLHNPPYVKANRTKWHGLIYDFVQAGLIRCFRRYSCNMTKMHWREVFSEEKLSSLTLEEKTDIAIPITPSLFSSLTEELSTSRNWRVTLVTIVESPGLALVIDYNACKTKIEKIITYTILSAWPICAVILLLAGISGISIWALESSTNHHHFPSSFGRGSTEGFWWAFVTMTTVGYGDKVPRTMYGRLFSVVWILTGVCLISIFTAAITSAITVSSVDPGCKSTQGKRLAAINGSDAEKEARHRGAYVTTFETEMKMFDMLTAGDVDGVMLDRFKAYYYLDQLKNDNLRVALRIDTSLQYGVSLIDRGFPELTGKNGCLAEYFVNSRHRLDRTMKHYIMPVKPLGSPTETVGVLSIHSRANQHLLITSVCIFVSFLISGLLWEFLYRRNHFSFFKSSPRGNKTNGSPLINKELAEIQNALEKLTAQVHTVQENL